MTSLIKIFALLLVGTAPVMAWLPGDSLYQLPVKLETADGAKLSLSSLRGRPVLITMFYSHCTSVCPLIAQDLQNLEERLSPVEKQHVRMLMVSFDAEGDAPADLRAFEERHRIGGAGWLLARTSAEEVRLLAAALGIRYKHLPDQSFNHSSIITLLDQQGVVRAKTLGAQATDEAFVVKLKALVGAKAAAP
jgi:protein SCO1/2